MSRFLYFGLFALCIAPAFGQGQTVATCEASANPPVVRSEGLSERVGDIILKCSGAQPNSTFSGNLTLFLSVNVTNRLLADGTTDLVLTVNNQPPSSPEAFMPVSVSPVLRGTNRVEWNGLTFTYSPQGTASIQISNIRGNATQAAGLLVTAQIGLNATGEVIPYPQVVVGTPQTSLFASTSSRLFCPPSGAPLPETLSFSSLVSAQSIFTSTRVSEGFPSAFVPKSDWSNLKADTGVRILVRYTGVPPGARLIVPDFVAGSSADIPTAGGDLGFPASGGRYTPGSGQLLLVRIAGADANGAGGSPMAATPTAQTTFDTVSDVPIGGGSGYVVYEVVDGNPSVYETAQFPTWLGVAPSGNPEPAQIGEDLSLAPVSTVAVASATAPIPRFLFTSPGSDCGLLGDCSAGYFPQLYVDNRPIQVSLPVNQATSKYFIVHNKGSGAMRWTAKVNYLSGANWLRVMPEEGVNNGTVRIDLLPSTCYPPQLCPNTALPPGVYQANVVIDAGPVTGSSTVPVTLTVLEAQQVPPVVSAVMSAGGANVPMNAVPGSLASIFGANLNGNSVQVSFDGAPAHILYTSATQLNVQVPSNLTVQPGQTSAVVVTVDGAQSAAFATAVSDTNPIIFANGVLNQNGTVNGTGAPETAGNVIQVFATGLPANGSITAKIHDRDIALPAYAGPAPGMPGVQQVNIVIPADLPTMQSFVYVCGQSAATLLGNVCSPAQKIWIQQRQP